MDFPALAALRPRVWLRLPTGGGAFPGARRGPMPMFAPNRLTPLGFCPVAKKWELPSGALAVPTQHRGDRFGDREVGRIEKKRVGIML